MKLALMNGQTVSKAFVPLPGGASAVYGSGGTISYYSYYAHADWLGSARFASTPTSPTDRYFAMAYAPFGETYKESGSVERSFTGQRQEIAPGSTAGLYDFLFREYSQYGRWTSPDPAGIKAADPATPQTWNRYGYVANDPLHYVDPLGLAPPDFWWGDCFFYWVQNEKTEVWHQNSICFVRERELERWADWLERIRGLGIGTQQDLAPADCIEQNRFDNALRSLAATFDLPTLAKLADQTLTSSAANFELNVTSTFVTSQLLGNLGASLAVPLTHHGPIHMTSWQHWAGSLLTRATGSPKYGQVGKALGRLFSGAAAVITVGEGAWNGATIVNCVLITSPTSYEGVAP